MRWALMGLLAGALYVAWMLWKVRRDNRPGPRWPGDP